jgi:hypothetical protein
MQQQEVEKTQGLPKSSSSSSLDNPRKQSEKVATECILYGYKNKDNEWKVINKYEQICQGQICEDYPRSDPNSTTPYSQMLSGGDVVIRTNLSADANRKSKRYAGGFHWIKVTFDSSQSADRACFYSPQEIDGHLVFCELYSGHGPAEDSPIPVGSTAGIRKPSRTLTTSHSTAFLSSSSKDQDRMTLPRSFAMNNLSSVPDLPEENSPESTTITDNTVAATSSTVTSATVTPLLNTGGWSKSPAEAGPPTTSALTSGSLATDSSSMRQRRASAAAPTSTEPNPDHEFMTHIPTVRRTKLRPLAEALPPQPTLTERVLRSIPILSWFTGDIVGEGPDI